MEKIDYKIQKLIALYNVAAEQNRLYAEFRWKVFYYIAILNGGLFIIYFKNDYDSLFFRLLITVVAILFTIILYQFEKRHHELFDIYRNVGAQIEKLFDLENNVLILSEEIKNKQSKKNNLIQKGGHGTLLRISIYLLVFLWLIVNVFEWIKIV